MTLRDEIAQMLRTMPTDWHRQYRSGRAQLGVALPDVPSPEQAMMIIGITAGGRESGDSPVGKNKVPRAVKEAAMKGLRLSYRNNYGAWNFIGIARAIELALMPAVSDTTTSRMHNYLFRHAKDKAGKNFGNDATPSRGYMAWLNWGGDPAVQWLGVPTLRSNPRTSRVMYHASPVHNRAAIRATGLHPGFSASYGPPGVYMFRYDYFATSYHPHYLSEPMDVWEVETSGIKVHPDPEDPEAAVYTERDIPRTRVKLLGTYLDDEEVAVSDAEAARAPEGYMQEEWRAWWAACSARAPSVTGLWEKWLRTLPEKASMMKTVPRSNPKTYLFSYGSNSPRQLAERLGHSVKGVGAYAPGMVRAFRGQSRPWGGGVATLICEVGGKAFGYIAEVTEADLAILDRYEGAPRNYKQTRVDVVTEDGRKVKAMAYLATSTVKTPPSRAYLGAVAETINTFWSNSDGSVVTWHDITAR